MQNIFWNKVIKYPMELILKRIFIHFWNAAIVLKTSIRFHFNDNSIAMFPFSSLSIKETPLCKRIKKVSDFSFQKNSAKGSDDLQNLPMVFLWSFLLDIATWIGVLCCRFLMVSNAPFAREFWPNLTFHLWHRNGEENLSHGSKNWYWHQMK